MWILLQTQMMMILLMEYLMVIGICDEVGLKSFIEVVVESNIKNNFYVLLPSVIPPLSLVTNLLKTLLLNHPRLNCFPLSTCTRPDISPALTFLSSLIWHLITNITRLPGCHPCPKIYIQHLLVTTESPSIPVRQQH